MAGLARLLRGDPLSVSVEFSPGVATEHWHSLRPTTGDDGDTAVTAFTRPDDVEPPPRATVLVVDDEEMVRRLAARMLLLLGYKVLEARDGHEALQLLQRGPQRIGVVLTDLAMPGIGGRRLGETIAQCWPQVRVLYMSGFPAQTDGERRGARSRATRSSRSRSHRSSWGEECATCWRPRRSSSRQCSSARDWRSKCLART